MIRIIDTFDQVEGLFDNSTFDLDKWGTYINSIYKNCAHLFKDDIAQYTNSDKYTFEKDFRPVIEAVCRNPKLEILHQSFLTVTDGLNQKVLEKFGRELDIDVVLYLGLGSSAGWVTNINGIDTVLLGIEKILELNWHTVDALYGLIYHELGHTYQAQFGILEQYSDDNKKNFVWQLFTEGIAMYFEQALVGDFNYFHGDMNGWKPWCDDHFTQILADFDLDSLTMTRMDQRYFGDWSDYHGRSDVGYYLGSRFVQYLAAAHKFDDLIRLNTNAIYDLYTDFVKENL